MSMRRVGIKLLVDIHLNDNLHTETIRLTDVSSMVIMRLDLLSNQQWEMLPAEHTFLSTHSQERSETSHSRPLGTATTCLDRW
jgi:hypothetical protein